MNSLSQWLKKYFIPHTKNDFKPHFLRSESIMLSFFVIIIIELAFLIQVFIVFDKTNFLASVLPGVLTTLTNEKRAQNDAPPLAQNDLLTEAAQLKAEDMANNGYFAHTSPDGKTPWYWFNKVGYRYSSAGENLAVNFFESNDVAQAWMNSPSHRENILKKSYMEMGVGVANGIYEGKNTIFVVQLFGIPIKIVTPPNISVVSAPTPIEIETETPVKTPTPIEINTETTPVKTPNLSPTTPSKVTILPPPVLVTVAPVVIKVLGQETDLPITKNLAAQSQPESFIQKVLTSPREYVTYIYTGILILIILSLLLVLFIKSEITHPFTIIRGVALVVIIFSLLFINIKVLRIDTEIPTEGISANAISADAISY